MLSFNHFYQVISNTHPRHTKKNYLNVGKTICVFGNYSEGFVNFTK